MTRNGFIPFSIAMKREYVLLIPDDHQTYLRLVIEILRKDGFKVKLINHDEDLVNNIRLADKSKEYDKALAIIFDFDDTIDVQAVNAKLKDCQIKLMKYELLDHDNPGLMLKSETYRLLVYAVLFSDLMDIVGLDQIEEVKKLLLKDGLLRYEEVKRLYLRIIDKKGYIDQELSMSKRMLDYLVNNKEKVSFIKGKAYSLAIRYLKEKRNDLKDIMKNKAM